jgi:ABC-type multidrug transport system ATPase subunit
MDPAADPVKVKRQVGVVPEDLALFDRLTGAETLSFVGRSMAWIALRCASDPGVAR